MKRFLAKVSILFITLLLLPTAAFAQFPFDIAGAIGSVFIKLFGLILNVHVAITDIFLGVAVNIFNWVCSENFISLSYTRLDNPFIEIGWTLTRDLTNIFFVLALVAIGLGTALRLTGYQAKKALPTLIIIALLINFTPVICGLIVDATNIVMNFFITGGGREGFAGASMIANFATRGWKSPLFDVTSGYFWDPLANIAAVAGILVRAFFNIIAGIIYLLFALIFIIRYVAIWTLVILSPFAFACYILPATRNVWSQWWKLFIQWSLIGAIAAFFLYLGDHFISATLTEGFVEGGMAEVANAQGFALIMNAVLPQFIAIVFLFVGLFASLAFAPKGADAILKAGQRGFKASGKVLGTRTLKGLETAVKAPVGAVRGEAKRMAKTYRAGRRMGLPPLRATGEAIGRGWERRIKPAMRPAAVGRVAEKAVKAIKKETRSAIKDSAKAGWGAALGKRKKRKGEKCPACKAVLPTDADFCPKCGVKF